MDCSHRGTKSDSDHDFVVGKIYARISEIIKVSKFKFKALQKPAVASRLTDNIDNRIAARSKDD